MLDDRIYSDLPRYRVPLVRLFLWHIIPRECAVWLDLSRVAFGKCGFRASFAILPRDTARFHLPGQRLRTDYTDGDPDLEADFYIPRRTLPPAVLVENFFMDSLPDYRFLLSPEGQQAIVNTHVDGIIRYLQSLSS